MDHGRRVKQELTAVGVGSGPPLQSLCVRMHQGLRGVGDLVGKTLAYLSGGAPGGLGLVVQPL